MTPFLFVAATFFAGCGDDSADSPDIIGKWILKETDGIKATNDQTWYHFKADGKISLETFLGNSNGTWQLNGNDLTITTPSDATNPNSPSMAMPFVVKSIEKGRMVMAMGEIELVLEKE